VPVDDIAVMIMLALKAYARNACPKGKDRDCPKSQRFNLIHVRFYHADKSFLSLISNIMFRCFPAGR